MKLQDFLDQFVEGYLFGDLRSMAQLEAPKGQRYGAVGYPMVATTIAGIELLGGLTSPQMFHKRRGNTYFETFWNEIYSDHRGMLGPAVYRLLRHGVAHVFVAKPRITVIRSADNGFHLERSQAGDLIVNAITLAADLERCYHTNIVDKLSTLAPTMQARLNEMVSQFSDQSDHELPTINLAPSVDLISFSAFEKSNQSTASSSIDLTVTCNSPAVQPLIVTPPIDPSTN